MLKRHTLVAEVVGWVSSETVGKDSAGETSLDCLLWSQALLVTTRAWTLPFSRIVNL